MKLRNYFDWLIVLIVFSAPLLSLTAPHGGTGNYKLLIVLGLMFGWKEIRHLNRLEVTIFTGLLVLFLGNLISFINTEETSKGFTWLGKHLYLFLGVFAYAMVKPRFALLSRYFDVFLVVNAVSIASIAAYQVYYLGLPRAHGVEHPIFFGTISIVLFGLLLSRVLLGGRQWLLYIATLLSLFAAVLSETRGALIALPVIILLSVFYSSSLRERKTRIILSALTLIVILVSVMDGSPVRQRIEYTVKDLVTYSSTETKKAGALTLRFEFWRNSLLMWKERPLLGIGPGDYNVEMKRLIDSGKAVNTSKYNYAWTPHSNLVNALVTSGALGLILHIVSIYLIPLYALNKERIPRQSSIYLVVTLSAYFIFGLSTTWIATHAAFSMFMLFFLLGLAQASELVPDEQPLMKPTHSVV